MRNVWMWFYLSCKRYLRRLSFLVILLLLPAAAFVIRQAEQKEQTEIRIAVAVLPESDEYGAPEASGDGYAMPEKADGQTGFSGADETSPAADARLPLEIKLAEALTERADGKSGGMFRFYACGSEEEVKAEVASRRAECGYVILGGLRERLDENAYKRCIRVYTAPSTVAAKLSSEIVFSELIRLYDKEAFVAYVAEAELFDALEQSGQDREAAAAQAGALYQKWKDNGSTFHFEYESVFDPAEDGEAYGRERQAEQSEDAAALFPVRGIAAVYIFIVGLYSAAVAASDEEKGLFLAVPYHIRGLCQIMSIAAPVVLAALSGLAALLTGNAFQAARGPRELLIMSVYAAAVAACSWLVRLICKRAEVIYCLMPVCMIGSLIFCPVFIDISHYLPALGGIGRIFLPWYYLRMSF